MLIFHCIGLLSLLDSVENRCYQSVGLFCSLLYWHSWFETPPCPRIFRREIFTRYTWPLNVCWVFCKILSRIMNLQHACFSSSDLNPARVLFSSICLLEIPCPTLICPNGQICMFLPSLCSVQIFHIKSMLALPSADLSLFFWNIILQLQNVWW